MSLPAADENKRADGRTTMELGAVLPRTAEVRDGHLFIGGVDMVELARTEGTALYVFDEEDLRFRMDEYKRAFGARIGRFEIVYASKAFQNKEMVRLCAEKGLWLDISGGGEFACAMAVGFPASNIVMHGNNKTPAELREAMSAGVGRIVVDSRIELHRISRIAGELGIDQDVLMRVTPGIEADTHDYIRTGCEDSKFGFTMRDDWAFNCVEDFLNEPNVNLVGIHCHIGSQIFGLESFIEEAKVSIALLARIEREYGVRLDDLDLGGGLGIAYTAEDGPSAIDEYAEALLGAVKEACREEGFEAPRIMIEPGRSIVANAGVTLYTVGILKTLPMRKYVAVDGGLSDNIRTALYHADYEPTIANKADELRTEIVTIAGKHCESGDVVVLEMSLQHPDLDDIICVFATGAYCMSMASNYNGQPRPAVVWVRDGKARVVTRRETYEDLMARDI